MSNQIKTVYVIHHSHTDIGYTDLQERVIDTQADYIRTVLGIMENPENKDFRWNCETLFCVEEFFKTASPGQREAFLQLAAQEKIGLSASYLNFTDLLDCQVYRERLAKWQTYFSLHGSPMRTAMIADINGISMGYRDAMLDNGIAFLFTNIHCHHGMYPLRQNQNAFFWENAAGKRLLVWNGEHYNLGNVLGIRPDNRSSFMIRDRPGLKSISPDAVEALHQRLKDYLTSCETQGYPYDFIITAVSGVFSDNAPPEPMILRTINAYNNKYGQDILLKMVSLQELYDAIGPGLSDAPVYHGDLTDWWANGIGSTPCAVKHYLDARRRYQLCRRLDEKAAENYPELCRAAQDNLLLYAEHTWGHSSTVTNPYDTMVQNLDIRKTSYASRAHEAASRMLTRISAERGDILRYYSTTGTVKACGVNKNPGARLVEFFIESPDIENVEIRNDAGKILPCQVSLHPRGRTIRFVDNFGPYEEKTYAYRALAPFPETNNTRQCYMGAEQVRDIVNTYDPVTYRLPYEAQTPWFRLCYRPGEGIISLTDRRTGRELLGEGAAPFFTPIYEVTPVSGHGDAGFCWEERERRYLGRNIRGRHARMHIGDLKEITCTERGPVFTLLRLRYDLPGTIRADMYIKLYEAMPRIDFCLQLGKTISTDIENLFLPLNLHLPDSSLYLRKGGTEIFRPGIDQLPGTCMEFYMSDDGLTYVSQSGSALIAARDTALVYMGEMRHHPIRLCDGKAENNHRPVYSWIMNNSWETNFKMDLSGFCEYCYSLWMSPETNPEKAMDELKENIFDPYVLVIGQN